MQNGYILKNGKNEILYFYYGAEKAIYYKKYEKGYLLDAVKIIDQVGDNFEVDFYKTGEIYLLCQALNGDIILCKEEKEGFVKRNILKLDVTRRYKMEFKTLLNETDMTLIYNIPIENSKDELLVKRNIGRDKTWTDADGIDSFSPFNLSLYKTQKVKNDHIVVLYQKKERESILGYREVTPNKFTSFNIFHKTSHQITDQTFLATKDYIHFLYVVKNIFTSQIIYRRRDDKGFSNPIVLYEGTKIRSCSLGIIKGVLHAFWIIGSNLFFATSNDSGDTFSNNAKNSKWISNNSRKVEFISFEKSGDFIFNELYIDANDFTNIQFIRDQYPDFFKTEENLKKTVNMDIINENNKNLEASNIFNNNENILQDNFLINFNENFEKVFNINKSENFINLNSQNIPTTVFKPNFDLKDDFNPFSDISEFDNFRKTDKKVKSINNDNKINTLQNKINNMQELLNQKNKELAKLNKIIKVQNDENEQAQNILEEEVKLLQAKNSENEQTQNKLEEKVKLLQEQNYKMKESYVFRENDGGEEIEDVRVKEKEQE